MRLPASPATQACLSRALTQTANTQSLLFLFFLIISLPVPIAIVLSAFVCYVLLFFKVSAVNQTSFPGAAKRKWLGSIYRKKSSFLDLIRSITFWNIFQNRKGSHVLNLMPTSLHVVCLCEYMNKIGFIYKCIINTSNKINSRLWVTSRILS
jgi:hypothetical protein